MSQIELIVPDIGDFDAVEVIEILVKPGDEIALEQSLITVESDKASMEIPAGVAGRLESLTVKLGDKVSKGTVIGRVVSSAGQASAAVAPAVAEAPQAPQAPQASQASAASGASEARAASQASQASQVSQASQASQTSAVSVAAPVVAVAPVAPVASTTSAGGKLPHASPSVRRFARELGVDLQKVLGTGPKGRITQEDVQGFVKGVMARADQPAASAPTSASGSGVGLDLLPWPKVDFEKFGAVRREPLSRIKKISGANLHRNWVMIPHVTGNDEADITDLEAFRVQMNKENEKSGIKLTMLAFLIKAVVAALKKYPTFNASLDGDTLVLKDYFHIGFAADTPNGLVVPVIRDADKKGILAIAEEMSALAKKARDGKLSPAEMQGGCFSISSLGGIGGTHFTPIINAPEVAILGVSKSSIKPVWDGSSFQPRLMVPLSLSYDHRVIDGAAAARFNALLVQLLADFRRITL